ncbi:MAG: WD40 repeat domain-containing protein, partial [Myxococcota bacterium]
IVTGSWDRSARVWNADGSGPPVVLSGHTEQINSAAFSPDGQRVITASDDMTARVWNGDGDGQPIVLAGHSSRVFAAQFSPDGQRVVTASHDRTARVWNADGSGQPIALAGHHNMVLTASFSPDGRQIATASGDTTVRLWNADGTGSAQVLAGHRSVVRAGAGGQGMFDRSGTRLVSCSDDEAIRLWTIDGSRDPVVLRASPVERMTSCALSPDGTRLVTTSHSGNTAWIWNDLEPLSGPDDHRLWTATRYCISAQRRVDLFGVSAKMAQADHQRCLDRVAAAQTGATDSAGSHKVPDKGR